MNEMERDPRVDAAWRAANRDEPPAHLNDAIRAAARRAVEAGPQRKRDKHWWYPFAAAATVAVIAVGLLQLTPPEQITSISTAPKLVQQEAASPPASPPAPAPPSPARESSDQASTSAANSPSRASNAVSPSAAPPMVVKKEVTVEKRAQLAGAMQNERKPQRQLDTADRSVSTAQDSPRDASVPTSPSEESERRSEAFPAAKQEALARRDAAVSSEEQTRARAAAPQAPPPTAAPPASGVSGVGASRLLEQKQSQTVGAFAKDALEAQAKSKTAPHSAEDWIKLIRQLRSEGRVEEATKEIAAFRSAYGDRADAMLPVDLRQTAPASPASAK
jgi:hypothetical protein